MAVLTAARARVNPSSAAYDRERDRYGSTDGGSVSDCVHLIITGLLDEFVEIRRQQVIKDETQLHANLTQLYTDRYTQIHSRAMPNGQAWPTRKFANWPITFESNRNGRFDLNLEALQVPSWEDRETLVGKIPSKISLDKCWIHPDRQTDRQRERER